MPREDDRTAQLLQRDPFYHAEVGGARGKLSDGILWFSPKNQKVQQESVPWNCQTHFYRIFRFLGEKTRSLWTAAVGVLFSGRPWTCSSSSSLASTTFNLSCYSDRIHQDPTGTLHWLPGVAHTRPLLGDELQCSLEMNAVKPVSIASPNSVDFDTPESLYFIKTLTSALMG